MGKLFAVVVVMVVLMVGASYMGYMVYEHFFPLPEVIEIEELEEIETYTFYDYEGEEVEFDEDTLDSLKQYIAAALPLREYANDDSPSMEYIYEIYFTSGDHSFMSFIYEEDDNVYLYVAYSGIYLLDSSVLELFN